MAADGFFRWGVVLAVGLEALQVGARVRGLAPDGTATVKSVEWYGDHAIEVIQVRVPDGVEDKVVRTVTENANTLGFGSHGFEKE